MPMDLFKKKKGQLGLVDIFSMIMYFIAVLIILLILNIAGCFIDNKAKAALGTDADLAKSVKADAQLNSMLATQMPDAAGLKAKLDQLDSFNRDKNSNLYKKIDVNFGEVQGFLNSHPELFKKKDYSGFIAGLNVIYKTGTAKDQNNVVKTFKAVSAAMFLRALKDYPKKGEYLYYLLPVGVDFNPKDFKPSSNDEMCDAYTLCVEVLPPEIIPEVLYTPGAYIPITKVISQSVQLLPLVDSTIAKIEFRYYPELPSTLPQP